MAIRAAIVTATQLAGAMSASIIIKLILPGNEVIFTVSLGIGITVVQGLFIEMFLTFELVLTILMIVAEVSPPFFLMLKARLANHSQKRKATFIALVGIALALFIAHLVRVFCTGARANPTRVFGLGIANLCFPGYHWLYFMWILNTNFQI